MERAKRADLEKLKGIDLVAYLESLGFEPVKVRNNDYWYLSPLRMERTPSFKVNRKLNRWYDFGEGFGGSIIDFGIRYHSCTLSEFVNLLISGAQHPHFLSTEHVNHPSAEPQIIITGVKQLSSSVLIGYLVDRNISIDLALKYLKQVDYKNGNKAYYGIGFLNDLGGYELRTPYFKGSSSPKYITSFKYGLPVVGVFEGFMDFLSYLELSDKEIIKAPSDFLILNSLSFVSPAIELVKPYPKIQLFLDNDSPGSKQTDLIQSQLKRAEDMRKLYKHHKDVNDFLCKGRKQRHHYRRRQ